jgi:hypothetical protein
VPGGSGDSIRATGERFVCVVDMPAFVQKANRKVCLDEVLGRGSAVPAQGFTRIAFDAVAQLMKKARPVLGHRIALVRRTHDACQDLLERRRHLFALISSHAHRSGAARRVSRKDNGF